MREYRAVWVLWALLTNIWCVMNVVVFVQPQWIGDIPESDGYGHHGVPLSRPHLSRITAYLEAKILSLLKHENLTIGKKYPGKEEKLLLRSDFSSFPQYFQYISKSRSQITYTFVECGCLIYFSSILQT